MQTDLAKDPGQMTDQELAEFLASQPVEDPANPDSSEATESQEPAPKVSEGQPAEPAGTGEPAGGEPDNSAQPEGEYAPEGKLAEVMKRLDALESENREMKERNANLQRLNGNLSNEVGVLRRKLTEPEPEPEPEPTDLDALEKPVDTMKKVASTVLEQAEAEKRKRADLQYKKMVEVASELTQRVPDFAEHIDEMAAILEKEDASPQFLRAFRHNPVAVIQDVPHLVHLAERAKYAKRVSELENQLKEAQAAPDKMAKGLKDAATAVPAVSSQNVRTPPKKPVGNIDFTKMSDAELNKFLEENKRDLADGAT